MREDMGKVLVERPRPGSRAGSRPGKGYRKRANKALDAGDAPTAEGMKKRYGHNTRFFNEHLGPLRRFLNSNVGRPWDKVYAEICQHVDRGNVVQKHILTHLFQYVAVHTVLIDGEPCQGADGGWFRGRYGDPLRTSHRRHQWYVCPKSGLLRMSRYVPGEHKPQPPAKPRHVMLSKKQMCAFLNGRWELITVSRRQAYMPLESPDYDTLLREYLDGQHRFEAEADRIHKGHTYTVTRRLLSRRELLGMPVPAEWLR